MVQASFRFYAELNDHLSEERRQVPFVHCFDDGMQVGTIVETIGVPTSEVDLILANGESVDLSHPVKDGDRMSIYPVFETFDISTVAKVRSVPLRHTRFILDVHLGKLAAHLRMLGFDTLYRNDYNDDDLLRVSSDEKRILLSKDRRLLKDSSIKRGYRIRANIPRLQLVEVMHRFDLFKSTSPFERCLRCNSVLQPTSKEDILDRLPLKVRHFFEEFRLCQACNRIYWKGGHYQRMHSFIRSLLQQEATE